MMKEITFEEAMELEVETVVLVKDVYYFGGTNITTKEKDCLRCTDGTRYCFNSRSTKLYKKRGVKLYIEVKEEPRNRNFVSLSGLEYELDGEILEKVKDLVMPKKVDLKKDVVLELVNYLCEGFEYIAQDEIDGSVYVFEREPANNGGIWDDFSDDGNYKEVELDIYLFDGRYKIKDLIKGHIKESN